MSLSSTSPTLVLYLFALFATFFQLGRASNVSNVLIYSYTAGFRHDSIPTAARSLQERGPDHGINFVHSEEPNDFNDEYLSQFDALLFLSTTEEVLTTSGKIAFQKYLDNGGNFIGVHAASYCLLNFATMEKTLGSKFAYHPDFTNATINVLDPTHPSTEGLPGRWHVQDEIYYFTRDPRRLGAVVVLSVDDTSYEGGSDYSDYQGSPHPIAWYMDKLKGTNSTGLVGRSWYTSLGHSNSSWKDDTFMSHVLGGVSYVLDSNTTRARNPSATVGSLGPEYEAPPPPSTPTTTVSIGAASSLLGHGEGLTLVGFIALLSTLWILHFV
ncbi:class I glutamine amidotransferase-like protein [Serendipita vermifera]|nr:class I glutamine amidotransferase-like protein [Serendipita vermifera]